MVSWYCSRAFAAVGALATRIASPTWASLLEVLFAIAIADRPNRLSSL